MRTISAGEEKVLTSTDRATHLRVEVDSTGSGDFVDLGDLEDRDWVDGVTISQSNAKPVASAQVSLWREVYDLSLSPLMVNANKLAPSGIPYIDIGRDIKISTAITARDAPPETADWELVFQGRIDEIDFGGSKSTMKLRCKDQGGRLHQEFIETQTTHGGGANIASVIQDVLTTHATAAPTLYVPSAFTFTIQDRLFDKEPILEAIRKLAQQVGADVRYRWDNGTSAFRLTLLAPDRSASVPDRTFGPDEYQDVTRLTISTVNVRNVIKVVFSDSAAGGERDSVVVSDASSIAKYGRAYMEIAEASSSSIDTNTEATNLADFALDDLKEPDADHSVKLMKYFSKVQLGDLYRFTANGVHYDNDQDFAVVGFTHNITRQSDNTIFITRGKPSLGADRWLDMDARGGNAPTADEDGPALPSGITLFPGVASIRLVYDPPAEADWYSTEVWMHTASMSSVTYPNRPATGSLVAEGKQTEFQIDGLEPNTEYFFRLIVKDLKGNYVGTSSQVNAFTQRVGPYHENADGQFDQLCRNSDFGIATLDITNFPPDFWRVDTFGTWGTHVDEDTSNQLTGGRAIDLDVTSGTEPQIESELIPFEGGDLAVMEGVAFANTAIGNQDVELKLTWYDSSKSVISTDTTSVTFPNGSYERRQSAIAVAPSTARYVQCALRGRHNGTDYTITLDQLGLSREYPTARRPVNQQDFTGGPPSSIDPVTLGSADPEESGISLTSNKYVVDFPGLYQFTLSLEFLDPISGGSDPFVGTMAIKRNNADEARQTFASADHSGIDFVRESLTSPWMACDVGDTVHAQCTLDSGTTGANGVEINEGVFSGRMLVRAIK